MDILKQFLLIALLVALPLQAVAASALNPAVAAHLEALTSQGEGTQLTELAMRKLDKPGTATEKMIKEAVKPMIPYLDASVRQADRNDVHMGIEGPMCFDAAPKLGLLFRALGLPGYVVACGHHVFMVVQTAETMLIVDPTIRQYFGQDAAPSWVPKVFVGTLSELKALYNRDPGLPVLPYKEIYFNADWPAYRRDSKMLSVRSSLLRSPNSKEFAPLTKYFNACAASHACGPKK
jgi:hypothetical protein